MSFFSDQDYAINPAQDTNVDSNEYENFNFAAMDNDEAFIDFETFREKNDKLQTNVGGFFHSSNQFTESTPLHISQTGIFKYAW